MKRLSAIAAGLLVIAFTFMGCASRPSGPGWTTLIDGENGLQNFTRLGEANWTAKDRAPVQLRHHQIPQGDDQAAVA